MYKDKNMNSEFISNWFKQNHNKLSTPEIAQRILVDCENQRLNEQRWIQNDTFSHQRIHLDNNTNIKSLSQSMIAPILKKTQENTTYNGDFTITSIISCGGFNGGGFASLHSVYAGYRMNRLLSILLEEVEVEQKLKEHNFINELCIVVKKNTTALHEAIVTSFGTNSLRHLIPNFPYCYGILNFDLEKSGLVYEKFDPTIWTTINLETAIIDKIVEEDDFIQILKQVVLAIQFAYNKINFTHYNLHPKNIDLLCKNGEIFTITYGSKYSISSKYIVLFKNFTSAHIGIKNNDKKMVHFGDVTEGKEVQNIKCGIFRERANPMTDIYKLIIETYILNPTFNKLKYLINYFNGSNDKIQDIVSKQKSHGYRLPPSCYFKPEKTFEGLLSCIDIHSSYLPLSKIYVPCGFSVTNLFVTTQQFNGWAFCLNMSFLNFFDTYSTLVENFEEQDFIETAKLFTSEFIRGFSRNSSYMNSAIDQFNTETTKLINIIKSSNSANCFITLLAYHDLLQHVKCFNYSTIGLYWKNKESELPLSISDIMNKFKSLNSMGIEKEITEATAYAKNIKSVEIQALLSKIGVQTSTMFLREQSVSPSHTPSPNRLTVSQN